MKEIPLGTLHTYQVILSVTDSYHSMLAADWGVIFNQYGTI